jgi:hypothetical protein
LLRLMQRIANKSVIRDQRYPFPLRQQHIAECVGLTPTHVSRVIGFSAIVVSSTCREAFCRFSTYLNLSDWGA